MSGSMVERVAMRIHAADSNAESRPLNDDDREYYRVMARAAIEAMREPTEEQLEAASKAPSDGYTGDFGHWIVGPNFPAIWQAMIDSALAEGETK